MAYKVNLDIYNGPMDLLLYLIRRDEVDIQDIPIARITEEFIQYVELLKALDIQMAGDFLAMAATLVEIKSRMLLPEPPPEEEEESEEDPRQELVLQLLEYRRFKGAATELDSRWRVQAQKASRQPGLLADDEPQEIPLDEVLKGIEVWDLFNAFAKVVKSLGYRRPREIVYDDTPIEEVAAGLLKAIEQASSFLFSDLFRKEQSRLHLITTFLALLELIRQRCIRAEQASGTDDIRLSFIPPAEREHRPAQTAAKQRPPQPPKRTDRDSEELKDILKEISETETTEFDEALRAIEIPDVQLDSPIDETSRKDDEQTQPDEPQSDESQAS